MLGTYGGTNKVPLTPTLVASHIQAHSKYRERVEREEKEKAQTEASIRLERDLKRKREADKEAKAEFDTKLKKYEDEESKLVNQLKFDETRLSGLEDTAEKTKIDSEKISSYKAAKLLREGMKKTQQTVDKIRCDKLKLVQSQMNKMSKK